MFVDAAESDYGRDLDGRGQCDSLNDNLLSWSRRLFLFGSRLATQQYCFLERARSMAGRVRGFRKVSIFAIAFGFSRYRIAYISQVSGSLVWTSAILQLSLFRKTIRASAYSASFERLLASVFRKALL